MGLTRLKFYNKISKMDYKQRKIKMIEMRNKGMTLQKIADKFKISRERVRQIVNNIKTKKIQKIRFKKEKDNNIFERKKIIYSLLKIAGKEQMKKVLQGLVNYNQQLRLIENYFKNISKQTGVNEGSRGRYRELVRKRDNHKCQLCGVKWIKGRKFDVHHIYDENGENTKKCDKEFNKQITLCHQCHLRVDNWKRNNRGLDKRQDIKI